MFCFRWKHPNETLYDQHEIFHVDFEAKLCRVTTFDDIRKLSYVHIRARYSNAVFARTQWQGHQPWNQVYVILGEVR